MDALRRLRRRWSRWDTALLLGSLLFLGGAGLPLPGYSVEPGKTQNVADLVIVAETKAFKPTGKVLVATVALHPLSPFRALQAWLDDDIRTVPKHDVQGARERATAMEDSEQVAIAVALRRMGLRVGQSGGGARVERIEPGSPAQSRLVPGDVLTSVDGTPVSGSHQAIAAIRSHKPGEAVRLDVRGPDGSARVEEIELDVRQGGSDPVLGVALRTEHGRFDYPMEVRIEERGVGGDSAGLAFTLGLLDVLTPGELTGRNAIAVTGTIEIDGRVGKVGSVSEKVVAARRVGARYFLVPTSQIHEALGAAGEGLEVIGVSTLDEALAALERLGGDVAALE